MIMITEEQLQILKDQHITTTQAQLEDLINAPISTLRLDDVILLATICNTLYRSGLPCVSDSFYDSQIIQRIVELDPNNPYLHQVEPEPFLGKTTDLPQIMLSTNKAYSETEIKTWILTLIKTAKNLNKDPNNLYIRITPKLDGFACFDDGKTLYTRGDGLKGTDITHILDRGVTVVGDRGLGPGEIVVSKTYFNEHLVDYYENSRNFQGSVIREHQLSLPVQEACEAKAIVFHPFALLPGWIGSINDFMDHQKDIIDDVWSMVDYDVDGVVLECVDEEIKQSLGHTSHHHRWQLAFKRNEEALEATVIDVIPQTGKTGVITPVALIDPIQVSGALIKRVTVHNYGHIRKWHLGIGSKIKIVRSGLVIPKIVEILNQGIMDIPSQCPSCGSPTGWENDFLYCSNLVSCPAQLNRRLEYFFETLNNCDGFGPKAIEKITASGIDKVSDIYTLSISDFKNMGFGSGESSNLVKALDISRKVEINDWRFLAAFNIPRIGKGGSKLLLQHIPLLDLFNATSEQLLAIKGIGDKSVDTIIQVLKEIKPEFDYLYNLGFNLRITPLINQQESVNSPIANKLLVFTGTMVKGVRELMEKQAEALGAKVGSSVTSKTDYLVIGEKPGASKLKDAQKHNTKILTEQEYLELVQEPNENKVTPEKYKEMLINFIKTGGWVGQDACYFYPRHKSHLKDLADYLNKITFSTCLSGVKLALNEVPDLWTIAENNAINDVGEYAVSKKHKHSSSSFMCGLYSWVEEEGRGVLKPRL